MNIHQFLEIIYDNRDLLGSPLEKLDPEDTHPQAAYKGCPLRVALMVHQPNSIWTQQLFTWEKGECIGVNPCPQEAAHYLQIEGTFTLGLSNAWDIGRIYDDYVESEWNYAFAGFLVGITLRPVPLELTA